MIECNLEKANFAAAWYGTLTSSLLVVVVVVVVDGAVDAETTGVVAVVVVGLFPAFLAITSATACCVYNC